MPYVSKKRKKKRSQPLSRQVQNIWLGVLALLTLGAFVFAFMPKDVPVAEIEAASSPRAEKATKTAKPEPEPVTIPASALGAGSRSVFFGDSWTAGYAAEPSEKGYAYLAGDALKLDNEVLGVSGTGYLNPGPNNEGTYIDRLNSSGVDKAAELLVMQGGLNDIQFLSEASLEDAAAETFALAKEQYPSAAVVVIGPAPAELPVRTELKTIDKTLRAAAHEAGFAYISPIGEKWITKANYDAVIDTEALNHPSTEGHAMLGERAAEAIRSLKG